MKVVIMLQIKRKRIFEYLGIVIIFYSNAHEPIHVHGKFQALESKANYLNEYKIHLNLMMV